MSKPKKKKPNIHQIDKVAKAQHRNEYFRKIKKVLEAINCQHIYSMIPSDTFESLYDLRIQSINVNVADGECLPNGKLKWIRRSISAMMKRYNVQLVPDGGFVDLDTFFTAGATLYYFGDSLKFEHFPKAAMVKEALMPFVLNVECRIKASEHLRQIAYITGLMMSDFTKSMYWATVRLESEEERNKYAFFMKWHSTPAERKYVFVKGEKHIVYRLCTPEYQEGVRTINILELDKDISTLEKDIKVPVYLQAHALLRLAERLDCLTRERIMMDLINSLLDPQIYYDDKTEKFLIEYRINGIRAGYLLATLCEKNLIIRTFLFITHKGTPEGDKLHESAKLKKNELEFLELDRLSTFMTSEIQNNPRLKNFFTEIGCKPLFELYKIFADKDVTITKHPNTTLLEDYLGVDLTKEYQEENQTDAETDSDDEFDEDETAVEENTATKESHKSEQTPATEEKQKEKAKIKWYYRPLMWLFWLLIKAIELILKIVKILEGSKNESKAPVIPNSSNRYAFQKKNKPEKKKISVAMAIFTSIIMFIFLIPASIYYVISKLVGLFIPKKKKEEKPNE
jgi:hypothetical protein